MKAIFYFEFLLLFRSKAILILTAGMLVVGIYSLYKGSQFYAYQKSIVTELREKNIEYFKEAASGFHADTLTKEGKWKYKNAALASWGVFTHRFYAYWAPDKLSALCIGSRDVYPFYQELMPLSLYMRLFKNEISNPIKLLAGNIDFSFVIIFLLPIFIIGLTFNIVADDRQTRIYPIIEMITKSVTTYYAKRYLFYAVFISLLLILLFLIAFVFILPVENYFSVFKLLILSLLYAYFWIVISFAINIIKMESVYNVGILVGTWLILLVLVPSIANQLAISRYPIDTEQITNTVRRVQLDSDRKAYANVMNVFYSKFPQYHSKDTTLKTMQDLAYVASGQLNDLKGDSLFAIIETNMIAKENFLSNVSLFNPCMAIQNSFSNTSKTNLGQYLAYIKSLQDFNRRMKKFYYIKVFGDNKLTLEDYKNMPQL